MTSTEDTQDLTPALVPSESYRYVVGYLGSRHVTPATTFRYEDEYGTEVRDTWTGDVMTTHWAATAELASLVAETQCAERNAPAIALTFASKLALYMDRAREVAAEEDHSEGDVLEDVDRILVWHLKRLRGLSQEPLDQTQLRIQAPEFNR